MNIFLCFLQSKVRHAIPAYSFWEYYIKNGIEESGNDWVEAAVDWAYGIVPKEPEQHESWKDNAWETTLKFLRENKVDLFLSYLYPEQIDPSAVIEIRRMGIPCINFFCDNIRMFSKVPAQFKCFDFCWIPEFGALKMYKEQAVKVLNLPMPMWVPSNLRSVSHNETNDISFIGSHDVHRMMLFDRLLSLDNNMPLSIYGHGWENNSETKNRIKDFSVKEKVQNQVNFIKNWGVKPYIRKIRQAKSKIETSNALSNHYQGLLTSEQYTTVTRESKVTLGVNRYPDFRFPFSKPNRYSRLRDIEAPMLGACYLTEWCEGIEHLYDINNEVLTYKDVEELREKLTHLMGDARLRKKLRMNSQKQALTNHSVSRSIGLIKGLI